MPERRTRTSPAAASSRTAARTQDITPIVRNGTPPEERPELVTALTPRRTSTEARLTATPSAAPFHRRVHGDTGRTVVSAVPTKYRVIDATSTFDQLGVRSSSRIVALTP